MALTAEQQKQLDEIKAGVEEIKTAVQQSLNLQSYGGYHIFNLALPLEEKIKRFEESVNAEPVVTEPTA